MTTKNHTKQELASQRLRGIANGGGTRATSFRDKKKPNLHRRENQHPGDRKVDTPEFREGEDRSWVVIDSFA